MLKYRKLMENWYIVDTGGTLAKTMEFFEQLKILNFYIIWRKIWYYIENYWIFIYMKLYWKQQNVIYYGEKYDTLPETIELWYTMEKNMALFKPKYVKL